MSYKIGSFNCLSFGRGESKNVQVFVDIILKERFDILALQEIHGPLALYRILDGLPKEWEGFAEDTINDYAFIWNTRRVELAHDDVYHKVFGHYTRNAAMEIVYDYNSKFPIRRPPFYARFFVAPFTEIRLINTHIRSTKSKDSEFATQSAIDMRRDEMDILIKEIYARKATKRYGNNRQAITILLGDYNLNMRSSEASSPYLVESIEISDNKVVTTVQRELTTLTRPPKNNDNPPENVFVSNFDHFSYDTEFSDLVISCGRVNTVEEYYGGDYQKHLKEVSDHVPIKMNINLK